MSLKKSSVTPVTSNLSYSSALALIAVIIAAAWYQVKLLGYMEWGDESETIVAARMLASGMHLYSDIFNHHGPLTFLPGYLLEQIGHFNVASHRIPIAVLQWLALLAVYQSPVIRERPDRNIFIAITITATVCLLADKNLHGHTYIYQVIAGLFVVIIIAQYTIPSLAGMECASRAGVAIGSILIVCLPFLAVTYLPSAALLFVASYRRKNLYLVIPCTLVAILFNLSFLSLIGSFEGYAAYHFYLNAKILPLYNGGQNAGVLIRNILSFISTTAPIEAFISFVGLFITFSTIAGLEGGRLPWRTTLLGSAIATLLMRGTLDHGATFWYAYIGISTICLAQLNLNPRQRFFWQVLVLLCVFRLSYPLLVKGSLFDEVRSESTEFGNLAKAITGKDDRVIAYSFRNFEYLAADRLPASGHFFYLPWQAKYNEEPIFGISTDPCKDIRKYSPKLMLIDKWLVWNKYPWDSYAGCVQDELNENYRQLPKTIIFVRKDYFDRALSYLASQHK